MRPILNFMLAVVVAWLTGCASNSPVPMGTLDQQRLLLINVALPDAAPLAVGVGGKPYGGAGYTVPRAATQQLAAVARDYRLRRLESWPIAALALHCGLVQVPEGVDVDALLTRLRLDKRVRLAQRVNQFDTLGQTAAAHNDPYFGAQFDTAATRVAQVHERHRGAGSTVAIIDTGADVLHADLAPRVAAARNFVDDDDAQFLRDIHGTAVAGIIAAEADNGVGIVGIAPQARLQILKACWQIDDTGGARCNTFTLAKALAYVFDTRPDVVNLSLAGPADPLLAQLLERIIADGAVVVGALSPERASSFPAAVPGVVAVSDSAVGNGDVIVAPGSERLTTRPRDGYDFYSGHSMAAAYVSAVAALLRAHDQALPPAAVAHALAHPDSNCVVQRLLTTSDEHEESCP